MWFSLNLSGLVFILLFWTLESQNSALGLSFPGSAHLLPEMSAPRGALAPLVLTHRVQPAQSSMQCLTIAFLPHGFLYLFFQMLICTACDLNSLTRDQACTPALGVWRLNLWTTRDGLSVSTIYIEKCTV